MELRESEISNSGKVIFTTASLSPDLVVATYYVMLVYENLSFWASRLPALYGEGVLAVPDKRFLNWSVKLDLYTPLGRPYWVFPAPFGPAKFINDPRYITAEALRPSAKRLAANP